MLTTWQKQIQVKRLIDIGRFDQAETILREILAAEPEDQAVHEMMGQIALKRKDLKTAHQHIEKALALNPKASMPRTLLFHYLFETRNLAEAEQVIRDLITDHPNTAIFHRFYAELALLGLSMDRVELHINEALRLDPADHISQLVRFFVDILEGRMKEGSDRLRELIREHPESEEVFTGLCVMLNNQGRYAEALEIGRQILRERPGENGMVEVLLTLKIKSHWSTFPLWPFYRFGSAGFYGTIVGLSAVWIALEIYTPHDLTTLWILVTMSYIGYSVYYPRLLRHWFRSRGL